MRGNPTIESDYQAPVTSLQFCNIRHADPYSRIGPNWESLNGHGQLVKPLQAQLNRFDALLNQVTPPGPTYLEFLEEIWARGFEVFVVGGTVRDVLANVESNDVDVVTTMPLFMLKPLVRAMYQQDCSGSIKHGYIRIGGSPKSGDPFIDVKVFCHAFLGTKHAMFGSDFEKDLALRDFACNSVYYEPCNKVLVDPSGRGISDAEGRQLDLVCNSDNPIQYAQIWHRYWKFTCRGFAGTKQTAETVNQLYASKVPAMDIERRIRYMHTQFLSKYPESEHPDLLEKLAGKMKSNGAQHLWDKLIAPHKERILIG